jgi:putative ABC transport system substrate-binding protein
VRAVIHRSSRRQFLRGSLVLVGLGLSAGCQGISMPGRPSAKIPRLGLIGTSSPTGQQTAEVLFQGLRELGYVQDQTIVIDRPIWDGSNEQVTQIVTEMLARPVDVVISTSAVVTQTVKRANDSVPIVMANFGGDPVALGFAASLAHPGGSITGLLNFNAQLSPKRLQILREIVPTLARLGVLWDPAGPSTQNQFRDLQHAAESLGIEVQSSEVNTPDDFEAVGDQMKMERVDGLIPLGSPLVTSKMARLAELTTLYRVPSIYEQRSYIAAGGLLAYGTNIEDLWRRAATYVDRILKGSKPGDLPIEGPTTFDFAVNLKTARALGLTIPPLVLQQATEVIQ